MTAFGVVLLWLGCAFQTIDLTIAACASLLIVVCVLELGVKSAVAVYAATSVLSLLLLPSKLIAVMYALYVGCYPILKATFERLPKILCIVLKAISCVIGVTAILLIGKYVFHLDEAYTPLLTVLLYALALLTLLIFDYALKLLINLYHKKLRHLFGIDRLMKP